MQQNTTATTTGLSVVCTPEMKAVGAADKRSFLVMASITAPEYQADKRAPVDMICVIDRSGSMSGERLDMAKSTVEFVVTNLQHDDRLGIVTYDDAVTNHFTLRPMTPTGKEAAIAAVRSIAAGGSTNLCGGLVEGVNQMRYRDEADGGASHHQTGSRNEVASVLLFTDGQANVGYAQAEDIIKATINARHAEASQSNRFSYPMTRNVMSRNSYRQQPQQQQPPQMSYGYMPRQQQQQWGAPVALPTVPQAQNPSDFSGLSTAGEQDEQKKTKEVDDSDLPLPCTINTFGFGADHDATLLKKIADHGQGMYYYIDSTKAIAEAFADCLGGLLSVVGQDIKVRFEAPPQADSGSEVTINRVLTKFKSTVVEPGRVYELALGDIQSEERRDILVEVSIGSAVAATTMSLPVLKTTVTYTNVITGQRQATAEHTATIARPAAATGEARDYAVDRQLNRWLAAEAMEQSNEAARQGDMEAARAIIQRAIDRIKESVSRDDEFSKSLVADLGRCLQGLTSHQSWSAGGSKMLSNQMQAHYVQRSTNVAWGAQACYQSSARNHMQQAQQQIFKPS